jgi:hypothetical protein
MFGPLKQALCGGRIASDDEVMDAVHTWLPSQPKTFFICTSIYFKNISHIQPIIEDTTNYVFRRVLYYGLCTTDIFKMRLKFHNITGMCRLKKKKNFLRRWDQKACEPLHNMS